MLKATMQWWGRNAHVWVCLLQSKRLHHRNPLLGRVRSAHGFLGMVSLYFFSFPVARPQPVLIVSFGTHHCHAVCIVCRMLTISGSVRIRLYARTSCKRMRAP